MIALVRDAFDEIEIVFHGCLFLLFLIFCLFFCFDITKIGRIKVLCITKYLLLISNMLGKDIDIAYIVDYQ